MKHTRHFSQRSLIFLLGVLISVGCWILGSDWQATVPAVAVETHASVIGAPAASPKVVFFGSSTTVGVGATRGDRRWSTLLSRYLDWQEFNESLSGSSLSKAPRTDKSWPIPAAVERWKDAVLRRHPDRVVMLYGANDAFWKLPLGDVRSPATFRGDLKKLLSEMTTEFRPDQLIVLTPQPNQATLDRRSPYDTALKEGARKIGAHFIDATQASAFSEDLAAFSADGLHLNNLGHAAFASYLAGKLSDQGITPTPPLAQGGTPLPNASTPLSGRFLRIDLANPLSFGEIRAVSARWVAPGKARFMVLRPDGRGGYEAIYQTPLFSVKPGETQTEVPRWWVLRGDRLAVWTDTNCLGSELSDTPEHLAFSQDISAALTDIKSTQGHTEIGTLAVWTAPPPRA
jgi:lysophospholipase L1-like esterase